MNLKNIIPLLCATYLSLQASWGQECILQDSIAVQINGAALVDALQKVSNASGVRFAYRKSLLDNKTCQAHKFNAPLSEILNKLVVENKLCYKKKAGQIIIHNACISKQYTIQGSIVGDSTGQPIPYASVIVTNRSVGAISNDQGWFELDLPVKSNKFDTLVFSSLGFHRDTLIVRSKDCQNLTQVLGHKSYNVPEATIKPEYQPGNIDYQDLAEIAAEKAGTNVIYIRDFKVKLSQNKKDGPMSSGKSSVYLNKGVHYRFTVANANNYTGNAHVELVRNGQKYANNNTHIPKYVEAFEFKCQRSATYQLLLNYEQEQAGYAAVIISMVYTDSMAYIEPGIPVKSDSAETIYLWTEHKIQIASSESRNADFKLTLSQGSFEKKGWYYLITPEHIGELKIKVDVYEIGKFIESDSVMYYVEYPPLPRISLTGNGYSVTKNQLEFMGNVELIYPIDLDTSPYTLKSFGISTNKTGAVQDLSSEGRLTSRQAQLIKTLETDESFYFVDIVFEDKEGKKHTVSMQEMVVQ